MGMAAPCQHFGGSGFGFDQNEKKKQKIKMRIETAIVSTAFLTEISSSLPPSQIQTCPQRAGPGDLSAQKKSNWLCDMS